MPACTGPTYFSAFAITFLLFSFQDYGLEFSNSYKEFIVLEIKFCFTWVESNIIEKIKLLKYDLDCQ